jgi:hypothetical protein
MDHDRFASIETVLGNLIRALVVRKAISEDDVRIVLQLSLAHLESEQSESGIDAIRELALPE